MNTWIPVDITYNGLRASKSNCGIGKGGFQKGNTCAKEDGTSLDDQLEEKAIETVQQKREAWHESREIKNPLDAWHRAVEYGTMARTGGKINKGPQRKPEDKAVELSKMLGSTDDQPTAKSDEFGSSLTSRTGWDRVKYGKGTRAAAFDTIKKAEQLGFEKIGDIKETRDEDGVGTGSVSMVTRTGAALLLRWSHGGRSKDDGVADDHRESRHGELVYKITYPTKHQQNVYERSREWADQAMKLGEEEIGKNLQESAAYMALGERDKARASYERGFHILTKREELATAYKNRSFFTRIKDFFVSAWNWVTGKGWRDNWGVTNTVYEWQPVN